MIRVVKAMLPLVMGGILLIVFLSVMIPIGMGVSNNLINAFPRDTWTTEMNTTINTLTGQTAGAFSLFTVIPIVVAAGIIIAVLFAVFRGRT